MSTCIPTDFAVADDPSFSYDAKIAAYLALANEHFTTDRYWQWCEENLPHLPEQVHDWVSGPDFDRLLRETVAATYPEHEHERFMAHFRGLTGMWVTDNSDNATTADNATAADNSTNAQQVPGAAG